MSDVTFFGWCAGVFVALALAIAFGANWLAAASCEGSTRGLRLQHDYSFMGGCRVNTVKDGWIPLDNYRSF